MKLLTQVAAIGLLLGLVLIIPAGAEVVEESSTITATKTELSSPTDLGPAEMAPRPDPVFLAGSSAGGAGGLRTGLVNGESSGLPVTGIMFEDHFCCPYGATGCDCSYFPGFFCAPLHCPNRTQPNCT